MTERDFATFFSPSQLPAYQAGVLNYRYRDLPCLKSPVDLAIYLRLLWDARPRTIFEIGSYCGGSALLLHDWSAAMGLDCQVVSIDIRPPDLTHPGVTFVEGDVHDLEAAFARERLADRLRPWLVIEDSAHTFQACRAALAFFAPLMRSGEYLVIEDGVLDELGLSERYDGGPNRAVAEFLREHPEDFDIARDYCDMFGPNATYNPNGYLRRR